MRKYRQRIHYTEADKKMMWDRWQVAVSESGTCTRGLRNLDPNT